MKRAHLVIKLVGLASCIVATATLADSFMNNVNSPATGSATPAMSASSGKLRPMSNDDFKSAVSSLGKANQAKLAQKAQEIVAAMPPSNAPIGSSTATPTQVSTGSAAPLPSTPQAQPIPQQPQRPVYNGFGTTTAPAQQAPASGGATTGFGIKY